jgi:hypothetical protein
MNWKLVAAAFAGLCFIGGAAIAGPESAQGPQPQAAAPGDVPPGVGATGNDVVILELGPAIGGGSAEESAAMQMLLLQLLMMQSEGASIDAAPPPTTSPGVGI